MQFSPFVSLENSNYLPCDSTLECTHQQKAPLLAKPNYSCCLCWWLNTSLALYRGSGARCPALVWYKALHLCLNTLIERGSFETVRNGLWGHGPRKQGSRNKSDSFVKLQWLIFSLWRLQGQFFSKSVFFYLILYMVQNSFSASVENCNSK